jgi:hypothetical protein
MTEVVWVSDFPYCLLRVSDADVYSNINESSVYIVYERGQIGNQSKRLCVIDKKSMQKTCTLERRTDVVHIYVRYSD